MSDLEPQLSPEQQFERDELVKAFREVLSSPSGKRVLFWILEQSAVYRDAFAGENNSTNYTLGLQAAGRRIIAMMDAIDPRLYPNLLLDIADMKDMARAANKENDDDEIDI